MIDRKSLVAKHNPILTRPDTTSPLTVGNGEFAYTVDITGTQSLYQTYANDDMPLCTMSQWGWNSTKEIGTTGTYDMKDVEQTQYTHNGKKVNYPVKRLVGSEKAYDWLRQNPHRVNLGKISIIYKGEDISISPEDIGDIHQELHLYEGKIVNTFTLDGHPVKVVTVCHGTADVLAISVDSTAELGIKIQFPKDSCNMAGADWHNFPSNNLHTSNLQGSLITRVLDSFTYYVNVSAADGYKLEETNQHEFTLHWQTQIGSKFNVALGFSELEPQIAPYTFHDCLEASEEMWHNFWETTGIVSFANSTDPRAEELERRIILSLYLSRIQCCGSLPPQETGLTCNSWHGKFHLEMHLWHSAYFSLFNNGHLLEKSLGWYKKILPKARENAAKNGYKGARWPKQVAYDGIDSPSIISPLLVWQQPHIVYMLELMYCQIKDQAKAAEFLQKYWEIVEETVCFMCDFLVEDKNGKYNLEAPLIPAQEEHNPVDVKNPTFEVEYFRYAIDIGVKWSKRLQKQRQEWVHIVGNMAPLPISDGLYLAHENCPNTFTHFNRDHPSMLAAFGLIPSERIDTATIKNTLEKVLECWEFETMWGWDFALMAMTATRLGDPLLAIDLLLMDTPKNTYVTSGNNFQKTRTDLPLYLPGNGSLLLAIALMLAGYGDNTDTPGIPKNGKWQVEFENISKFPN
ncbi:MAG: glycoside hydrolase family 65 [Defluviitaleaceae bacterium]|nr:glycoside hydrolase family 65 [Defluviitaleaceae bacterium]